MPFTGMERFYDGGRQFNAKFRGDDRLSHGIFYGREEIKLST